MSVYTTIFASSAPIGGLMMGAIASGYGPATAIALGGVLSGMVGLAAALWLRARQTVRGPAAVPLNRVG
jgi:hypothetical protein